MDALNRPFVAGETYNLVAIYFVMTTSFIEFSDVAGKSLFLVQRSLSFTDLLVKITEF